jgi:predicted transcriptional regulator
MSSNSSGQRPDEILKLMGDIIAAFVSNNSVAVWACRP